MRLLEILLTATVAAALVVPRLTGWRPRRPLVAAVVGPAAVLHVGVEGWRWQLVPLYIVAGLVASLALLDRPWPGRSRRRAAVSLAGIGLLAAPALLLPVPKLPVPDGPFAVGTSIVALTDRHRTEPYGPMPGGPRRLMAQVWYPATPSPGTEPAPWTTDLAVLGPAMSTHLGFPSFFLDHTKHVRSHSYRDAPPAEGHFPVVLYSHGWSGFRTIALNQVESLASHGFVVVAADHTYAAIATVFPDGTVEELDPAALPDEAEVEKEAYQRASELLVATYAGDLAIVLDALASGRFGTAAGYADLDRVGIFGHSTGGGAAVRACAEDARCDAVLGFDAWVEPVPDSIIGRGLDQPSLFMRSDGWRGGPNDFRLRKLWEASRADRYYLGLLGANHNDFVMTPIFSPIAYRLGLKGSLPSARVVAIIDEYLVGFFTRYLTGAGGDVLNAEPPLEVFIEAAP